MAYQDQGARPVKEMFDITSLNITCAECGAAIEKLPFEPTKKDDDTYGKLYCYDCNKQRAKNRPNAGAFGGRKF